MCLCNISYLKLYFERNFDLDHLHYPVSNIISVLLSGIFSFRPYDSVLWGFT